MKEGMGAHNFWGLTPAKDVLMTGPYLPQNEIVSVLILQPGKKRWLMNVNEWIIQCLNFIGSYVPFRNNSSLFRRLWSHSQDHRLQKKTPWGIISIIICV